MWTAATGAAYTVGMSYQNGGNQNVTGSPDYGGRMRIVGDIGSGCSSDPLRQFTAAGFAAPLVGSVGLESGADYLRGCFQSVLDMSIARNIRLGRQPAAAAAGGRVQRAEPGDRDRPQHDAQRGQPDRSGTAANLPFDASGAPIASRSLPKNAGFGVANAYQSPRTMQAQIRFSF